MSSHLVDLPIKIFGDGANLAGITALSTRPYIRGLTTNPTLMRANGVTDYEKFAREVLDVVKEKPISFEVFSDEFGEMARQARKISQWQANVYVKIPITDTRGDSALPLIRQLSGEGGKVNATDILTFAPGEGV